MRFASEKTATNVYEHFAEPTIFSFGEEKEISEKLKDFEEIHSVTVNFGSPEVADQMSGSIYMHASMEEDKCSQCLRLAEGIQNYSIRDLSMCLTLMGWWSSQAGNSLALRDLVTGLDQACIDRLASIHFSMQDKLRLGYQWQCLMFTHKAQFPIEMLHSMCPSVSQSSLPVLVSFLLILSSVDLGDKEFTVIGQEMVEKLEPALPFLSESELVAIYAGLRRLGAGQEELVRRVLQTKYGYRLQ